MRFRTFKVKCPIACDLADGDGGTDRPLACGGVEGGSSMIGKFRARPEGLGDRAQGLGFLGLGRRASTRVERDLSTFEANLKPMPWPRGLKAGPLNLAGLLSKTPKNPTSTEKDTC